MSFINYLRHAARRIKVRVFAKHGIKREGLADTLILNPTEFDSDDELFALVGGWLTGPDFAEDPIASTREELFRKLTADFKEGHWKYLEVMMVLSGGTTNVVNESHVHTMLGQMQFSGNTLSIKTELGAKGFLWHTTTPDSELGIIPIRLAAGFIDLITDELRRRGPI